MRLLETLAGDRDAASRRLAALALGELGVREPGALPDDAEARLRAASAASADVDLRRASERALARLAERGRLS